MSNGDSVTSVAQLSKGSLECRGDQVDIQREQEHGFDILSSKPVRERQVTVVKGELPLGSVMLCQLLLQSDFTASNILSQMYERRGEQEKRRMNFAVVLSLGQHRTHSGDLMHQPSPGSFGKFGTAVSVNLFLI